MTQENFYQQSDCYRFDGVKKIIQCSTHASIYIPSMVRHGVVAIILFLYIMSPFASKRLNYLKLQAFYFTQLGQVGKN